MAGTTTTEMQQVIDDVLSAESHVDGLVGDQLIAGQDDVGEIDEKSACSEIDGSHLAASPEGDAAAAGPVGAGGFVSMSRLAGVPRFFARGVPPRPQTFSVEPRFRDVLTETVKTVRFRAPASFGDLKRITSAGVLVLFHAGAGAALIPHTTQEVPLPIDDRADVHTQFVPVWLGTPRLARFQAEFWLLDHGQVRQMASTGPMRGITYRYAC